MNILYIAMGCSPDSGSEDKIGWNIPVESAKKNNVHVITIEKQRPAIENYLEKNTLENIHFYYVDIPEIYKKIFVGFLFSGRLNPWHKRVLPIARKICESENIEIVHQITPVEFRSIGNYGCCPGVKFVCGPVGGAESIPLGLQDYASEKKHIEIVRMIANWWCRCRIAVAKKLKNCDCLLFANQETKAYLEKYLNDACVGRTQSEIGISAEELSTPCSPEPELIRFLVAGRMIYRKGHQFLLDALERLPDDASYECVFLGDGTECEKLKRRVANHRTLNKKVFFRGNIPYSEVEEEYSKASVLVMPSIRETTGSVVLEAMSKRLPVVTIRKFGAATILDDETGWLYEGNSKEEYIENLKDALLECIQNPEEVKRKGRNARGQAENFTWEKKMEYYQEIYDGLMMNGA